IVRATQRHITRTTAPAVVLTPAAPPVTTTTPWASRQNAPMPQLGVAGHVIAAELRVVAVRHARVAFEVFVELVHGDRHLREHSLGGDLLAREDLLDREQRGAPLEVRVDRAERRDARLLPLAQEAQLVLARDDRVV